jgi:hypothetical protein
MDYTMKSSQYAQRGDALLMSIIMLLLMTLGFFAVMKVIKNDSITSGALVWHGKAKEAGDIALAGLLTSITSASNGRALEYISNTPIWYRTGNQTAPTSAYWGACFGNALTTARCDRVTQSGFYVYEVVQSTASTAQPGLTSGCAPLKALYYKIYLHVEETSGVGVASDTEVIYRLCV